MSEWIKWNGGECPVHPKTVVRIQLRCDSREEVDILAYDICASNYYWRNDFDQSDIIAYKIIQEYQPTIAETVRDAAINWPLRKPPINYGGVECAVIKAFQENESDANAIMCANGWHGEEMELQARTFMLLVAEALE